MGARDRDGREKNNYQETDEGVAFALSAPCCVFCLGLGQVEWRRTLGYVQGYASSGHGPATSSLSAPITPRLSVPASFNYSSPLLMSKPNSPRRGTVSVTHTPFIVRYL